ncbi:hypothetical protein [Halomonas sp. BC2]|uniref:hypothetical protein n=1 Tax=Halomonas sp. BC2 TaxID=1670449 RepID=UPI00201676B7|nr:hypothetical protein [Halomonas sp. BC2]
MNAVLPRTAVTPCTSLKPLCNMVLGLLLALCLPTLAQAQALSLIDGETTEKIAISDLREQPNTTFTVYDPYQGRDVEMRGIPFREFLVEHFGAVPPQLHFTAWDDYEVSLGGWDNPVWYLVTVEDGEPLTLRSRGPVRLVEREYSGRDTENLREFNDWIWMIRSIEVQW